MPVQILDYAVPASESTPPVASTSAEPTTFIDLQPEVQEEDLIEERFLSATSPEGIQVRVRGYTNHLSLIGQKYARELPDKIGIQADAYRETLVVPEDDVDEPEQDREEGRRTRPSLLLRVEALKEGKVLVVVSSRLSKEEEEVLSRSRPILATTANRIDPARASEERGQESVGSMMRRHSIASEVTVEREIEVEVEQEEEEAMPSSRDRSRLYQMSNASTSDLAQDSRPTRSLNRETVGR
ncbi:uncharacterized protein JCM15063_003951 [Sporobolomyces koalae]|uniref:uncharacterized protein n=1 Tax=Sporobolomyces koalae TaxID=500713 RepID=UPI00317EFA45